MGTGVGRAVEFLSAIICAVVEVKFYSQRNVAVGMALAQHRKARVCGHSPRTARLEIVENRTVALVAGTLFALHPAHTESVAWVTVPDPLMCIALIVSLLLYMEHEDRLSAGGHLGRERILRKSGKRRRNGLKTRPSAVWLMGSALAFFVALMVKETAIVWSVVMLATILIVPYKRLHGARSEQ